MILATAVLNRAMCSLVSVIVNGKIDPDAVIGTVLAAPRNWPLVRVGFCLNSVAAVCHWEPNELASKAVKQQLKLGSNIGL